MTFNVFISSTAQDLVVYRNAAKDAVLSLGWRPVMVNEHELIAGGPILQRCLEQVWAADLFVLLAGYRCGFVPPSTLGGDGQTSITQLEAYTWLAAVEQRNAYPHIIFMAQHPTLKAGDGECPVASASQLLFRDRLSASNIKHDFDYWPDGDARQGEAARRFATDLKAQLAHAKAEIAAVREQRAMAERQKLQVVNQQLAERAAKAESTAPLWGLGGLILAAILMDGKK